MKVPFEKIGPGQSGRLVYQVMGENGPIFNPNRISYLPADQAPSLGDQPSNLPSVYTSLAAMNLAASVGIVALSAAVLRQVQQLHAKVDQALFSINRVETKIDRLAQQVQRIDARVSENNLRHALDHILRSAIQDDDIDLQVLSRITNDLETFAEGIEEGFAPCGSFGLRLSSDVESKLQSIYKLLFGLRYFVYSQHNMLVQGDPKRVIPVNLIEDYFPQRMADPGLAAACRQALEIMWESQYNLGQKVFDQFTFSSEHTADEYYNWLGDALVVPVVGAIENVHPGAIGLALDWETDVSDIEKAAEYYSGLREHWLWHTSAGLVWRTYVEALAVADGYNDVWNLGQERFKPLQKPQLMLTAPTGQEEVSQMLADIEHQ